jgi:hypothetical protein
LSWCVAPRTLISRRCCTCRCMAALCSRARTTAPFAPPMCPSLVPRTQRRARVCTTAAAPSPPWLRSRPLPTVSGRPQTPPRPATSSSLVTLLALCGRSTRAAVHPSAVDVAGTAPRCCASPATRTTEWSLAVGLASAWCGSFDLLLLALLAVV